MDLYFLPMAGSFPAHVACLEAGIAPALHHVARHTKQLADGRDYRAIAPQGIVPVISLPDGSTLTETAAVLQYIADQAPERRLAPAWGTAARYRLIEWLNFTSTEVHKKLLNPLFGSGTPAETMAWTRSCAPAVLGYAERWLGAREVLVGAQFTVADAYLGWALLIAPYGGIALDEYPALRAYVARYQQRPSVMTALAHELPLYQRERATRARTAGV